MNRRGTAEIPSTAPCVHCDMPSTSRGARRVRPWIPGRDEMTWRHVASRRHSSSHASHDLAPARVPSECRHSTTRSRRQRVGLRGRSRHVARGDSQSAATRSTREHERRSRRAACDQIDPTRSIGGTSGRERPAIFVVGRFALPVHREHSLAPRDEEVLRPGGERLREHPAGIIDNVASGKVQRGLCRHRVRGIVGLRARLQSGCSIRRGRSSDRGALVAAT